MLIGGSSRLPLFVRLMETEFGKSRINWELSEPEVVALGAAEYAASMSGIDLPESLECLILLDGLSKSIGIETVGGVMNVLAPRNATIPSKFSRYFPTWLRKQAPSIS